MRTAWIVLPVLVAFCLPADLVACSCLPPPPPREALEQQDAVFIGTVTSIETTDDGLRSMRVSLDVEKRWKGDLSREATIYTAASSAACGFNFERGQKYLIYADESDGKLSTGLCHRTASLEQAQDDIEAFRDDGGLCGTPVGAVSAQIFVFLVIGLTIGRWPVYL